MNPKDWIDLLLTLVLAAFGVGKAYGWLVARGELLKPYDPHVEPAPYDEWRRGVEVRLSAGNEKFVALDDRFDEAGELISKLATRVQGLQLTIEDRADDRYAHKSTCEMRHAELDRRLAEMNQSARNGRARGAS